MIFRRGKKDRTLDRLQEEGGDVTGVERGRLEEEELRRVSTIFLLKRKGRGLGVFSDPKNERPLGVGRKNEKRRRESEREGTRQKK